jgi:hypothetical protein
MRMRGLSTFGVVAATVVAAAVGALHAGPAAAVNGHFVEPSPDDPIGRALVAGEISEAEYAYERALALVRPERARRLFGTRLKPDPREGTPIMRDLAARLGDLPPAKRAVATRLLARPTQRRDAIRGYRAPARRLCNSRFCVWWVERTSDAPSLRDRNRNRVPDWVDTTRRIFDQVWRAEVGRMNYRRPRPDWRSRHRGPNGKLDIYVADVGDLGLYGYCTSDDPARARRRAVSAYCVVDDDFSRRQFAGSAIGVKALRVTAAHEFFHAVQYAYDWLEDLWLMEGTATWIEDEVFDRIDDNRQYLKTSPISARDYYFPLDYYDPDPSEVASGFKYGAWIFWRYLSERYGTDLVRAVWRRADSNRNMPDEYSLAATVSALALRGQDFATVFGDFALANLVPSGVYSEGASYPAPRPPAIVSVGPSGIERTPWPIDHLASDYFAFAPGALAPGSGLTFLLDFPDPAASPRAAALVEAADGALSTIPAVRDEALGRFRIDVPAFAEARRVTLVLTNASTRFRCWARTVYSCRGRPFDDARDTEPNFAFEAAVTPPSPPGP